MQVFKKENLKINLMFNIVYQIVNVLSPLVVTPKISRIFGADYLGVKSYTFSIVYYFAIFGVLGLDMYGQRKIALNKDDVERRSKTFYAIFYSRICSVGLSIILYFVFITFFVNNDFEKVIFMCWIIYLIRDMINPVWFLQGMEKYGYIFACEIISQMLYVICVFIFVNEKNSLLLYIILFTAIPLLVTLFYFPTVLKYIKKVRIGREDIILSLKESVIYFIPTVATAIYSMVDKTILGIYDEKKVSTGLYEATEKLIKVALAISTSSFTIMRTRMSCLYGQNNWDEYRKRCNDFITLSMLFCWPIMFGIIGISEDFVPVFFGAGFEDVVSLSHLFALVVPCLTISGLLQAIYIFPFGLQKIMNYYYILIVIINVIMNFILIYFIGTKGAIIATITSESILSMILIRKSKKIVNIKMIFEISHKYILSSILMYFYINIISCTIAGNVYLRIMMEFFGAVVVYFLTCLLLQDCFVKKQINRMKNKILELKGNKT